LENIFEKGLSDSECRKRVRGLIFQIQQGLHSVLTDHSRDFEERFEAFTVLVEERARASLLCDEFEGEFGKGGDFAERLKKIILETPVVYGDGSGMTALEFQEIVLRKLKGAE
jgi:hypothetical protein